MHFPLTPHHVQLVAACYPPGAALATAGPDYKPNSQEVSRLTYYASNHPGKIAKISSELAKRVATDARKAKAGNVKSRASLLISLNIFKSLTTECRRDIALLSTSLMSALDTTLAAMSHDLEVAAKVASVFTAWAAYSDGRLLGVDQSLTRDYVSTMRRFASMCLAEARKDDYEERNRTRLLGLAALSGAVTSEALYNSSTQFKSQVSAIVPALLLNILQTDVTSLDQEAEDNKNHPLLASSYLPDSRQRPSIERRAASIHVHIAGEQGPSMADVAGMALRAFACLLGQSNGTQVGYVLQATFDSLGVHTAWDRTRHCCWLAEKTVEWIQYPYRYAVSTRLIERLVEAQDDERPSDMHRSLLDMIRTVFTVSTPVVNLSTSDVCANLVSIIMRRISINLHDELLPKLVECVSALGAHVYYADQIHDLACEIIARITSIDNNDLWSRGSGTDRSEERKIALRCLLAGLGGLIKSSNRPHTLPPDGQEEKEDEKADTTPAVESGEEGLSSSKLSIDTSQKLAIPNRTRIPLDVWQDTLSLLCDEDFTVRSDYAQVLVIFIENEVPPDDVAMAREEILDKDGVRRLRHLQEGPFRRAHSIKAVLAGDGNIKRFLNALHAALYVLAISPHLGLPMSSTPSPQHSIDGEQHVDSQNIDAPYVNIIPSTPLHDDHVPGPQEESAPDQSQGSHSSKRKSFVLSTATRKLNKIRRLLERTVTHSHSADTAIENHAACLSDYVHILAILRAVHYRAPSRALLRSLPMLLALNSWCTTECDSDSRRTAIKYVVVQLLDYLGTIWECTELNELVQKAQSELAGSSFPEEDIEPLFPDSEDMIPLSVLSTPKDRQGPFLDSSAIISLLARNSNVQLVTGLDETFLRKRLEVSWTPENALRDSVEQTASRDSRPESIRPILKISPGLMQISNLSLQSLTRSNRGVSVNDLRDALEGRGGMSSVALGQGKAPSIASFGAPTYCTVSGDSHGMASVSSASRYNKTRSRPLTGESPKEVRDVLDRLGIGSGKMRASVRSSVTARPSASTRYFSYPGSGDNGPDTPSRSMLIPPYKG